MGSALDSVECRESVPADEPSIETLYPQAFPDEDLLPLVRDLLRDGSNCLSLVATANSRLAGHVVFTACGIERSTATASLLAPLAVAPAFQRRGVGTSLVQAGLRRIIDSGTAVAFVLGNPAYYSRLGFEPEPVIRPPYPLPDEWQGAWQSLWLRESSDRNQGKLLVPSPWLQPALWAP